MRFIFLVTLLGILSIMPTLSLAQDSDHAKSLEVILSEMLDDQNISQVQDLDCDKISDEEFEELGDAVMEQYHPGQQHEVMDAMMGGEGSESLRFAHINMGQNYLGCGNSTDFYNGGMMIGGGMMGGSMMRNIGNYNGYGMMSSLGYPFVFFGYVITALLLWTLLIVGIVALIKWIKK